MRIRYIAATAIMLALASNAAPSFAQTVDFDGTRENVNPLSPPGTGRCAPPYFNTVNIAPGAVSSTGTSNIGTFESTQSHCITSPPPTDVVDGEFTYTFRAGDSITGTYSGNVAAGSTPGQFIGTENLVITGGTGRFVGAVGTILETGDLGFANGFATFAGTVDGTITTTATTTQGNFATAFGDGTAAMADFASAYGGLSIATGVRSTAVGSQAEAIAANATAIGNQALANGVAATALGDQTTASALRSTAVGVNAQATAIAATALGHNTVASALAATAVGVSAHATQTGATAVGRFATADFAGSTAIGATATTTAANQVALGGMGSSVRIGDIDASIAAQTGPLGVATVDANGTLGRDTTLFANVAALQGASIGMASQLGLLDDRVTTLFDLREVDRRDFRQGVAAATAMGQAPFPSEPGRTSYILNGAVFRGEPAVGGSLMHRLNSDTPFAIGLGFSFAGNKNNAFRAGVAGEF
ncbi:MAG: hypothetical protein C0510_02830 [Erythrobacter sp.]|nr:hypothetical protein [Erythrobacter sp.]